MAKRKPRIQQAEIVRLFAVRLKELRRSRGMTQAALASKAHVQTSYVGRLESGGACPGIDLLERLAKALGAPVAELLPDSPSPDTAAVLREQARAIFETLVTTADRETLMLLNPLLARLVEAPIKIR